MGGAHAAGLREYIRAAPTAGVHASRLKRRGSSAKLASSAAFAFTEARRRGTCA